MDILYEQMKQEKIKYLNNMCVLLRGWDKKNAEPIKDETIQNAIDFIDNIYALCDIRPETNGSIILTIETMKIRIDVFPKSWDLIYWDFDEDGNEIMEIISCFSLLEIKDMFNTLREEKGI